MNQGLDGLDVDEPLRPDYAGACISNVVPALIEPPDQRPSWLPEPAHDAEAVILLVLDGLGWNQLETRHHLAPTLASLQGGPISTVLPTTTATALTSLTTGLPPGEHGVIGYRIVVGGEVLNVLRWSTATGDARQTIVPQKIQPHSAFCGHRPPVVTRAEFARSGFTMAHLDEARFSGWRVGSTLATHLSRLAATEPFVYGYYDGIDKVSHEYGLTEFFDAEVAAADQIVAAVMASAPPEAVVVVTADHGQVHTGENVVPLDPEVLQHVSFQSGEGRFRWLHARPGHAVDLADACRSRHGHQGWVRTRDQVVEEGWFGPVVTGEAAGRLGDVALVAKGVLAFSEPTDTGPYHLVGRHGSATADELLVPLLAGRVGNAG